jgi:tyrosine-protein kinase Etk/Wzc
MVLIKTSEVLGGVVKDLKLHFKMNKVVTPDRKSFELKNVFVDFPDSGNYYNHLLGFNLPRFSNLKVLSGKAENRNYYILKKNELLYELRDAERDQLLAGSTENLNKNDSAIEDSVLRGTDQNSLDLSVASLSTVKFETDFFELNFSWDDAPVGSKIYFNIQNYNSAIRGIEGSISVGKVGATNVITVGVKSTSPFAAKIIAESLIDKFRESRIEQQKQTIRYSFKFIDEQLEEIRTKLLESEDNLSNFKSSGQIVSISESSSELIRYLSSLEAERLSADLLLTDYKNKVEEMKRELQTSGYFDQSFLEPKQEALSANTPFMNLLQQLSDYELQRLELLQRRSENHPDVKNLDEQIRLAKEKLGSYNQNTLTAYQIIINTLEKKLDKITNLMSRYEVRMQKLPAQESQMARLIREKNVFEKMFTLLLDKREEMRMAEVSKLQDIVVVDPPQIPLSPISPNKRFNMLIAFVLGGFVGILGIFIVELKNTKYINIDELEDDIQLPVLALVPKFPKGIIKKIDSNSGENRDKFVTLMEENSGIKESFRVLKTKILLQGDRSDKIILVTSCEENTGKNHCSCQSCHHFCTGE